MSSKLRSFWFSAWTQRRSHYDDAEVPPGRFVEPDMWLQVKGAVLVPADPEWKAGEGDEPDWSQGAVLLDPKTRRLIPGTNMEGRPMEIMIDAWRSGRRCCDGVLIFTSRPKGE